MNDKAQETTAQTQPSGLQYFELGNEIGMEACRYLQSGGLSVQQMQKLIGNKKKVREIARRISHECLKLVAEEVIETKSLLEKYFLEVYDFKIDLSKLSFQATEGMPAYMAVPPQLNEDAIMEALKKKYGISLGRYKNPAAQNINRNLEQKRSQGLYVFAHTGEDGPDAKHRGKSYDDAVEEKMTFANAKEYLLMTGFHKFTKGYFMDKQGWTRTSSIWSGGGLVDGGWREGDSGLWLYGGDRGYRYSGRGPRELFLLP